jgi:hypothetical protein
MYADFGGTGGIDLLRHNCGHSISYRNVDIVMRGTTGTRQAIELRASGESAGSATYTQDVRIDGGTLTVEGSGTRRGILAADSLVVDSTARASVRGVVMAGSLAGSSPVATVSTITNQNWREQLPSGDILGIYVAGDTTPDVSRGVTSLLITNASPTTITQFDGGVEGQRVSLMFTDGNTTLAYGSNLRTPGEQNVVSRTRLTMTMIRRSGQWYFEDGPRVQRVSAAQLADITHAINTSGKYSGKTVVVDTGSTDVLYTARASAAAAIWSLADGSATVTPS